jgi:hypothetical protein
MMLSYKCIYAFPSEKLSQVFEQGQTITYLQIPP